MFSTSFMFDKSPEDCASLAKNLKDYLPKDCEVNHGPLKDANGNHLGPYAVWASVHELRDLYVAYGFLAMYGGKK